MTVLEAKKLCELAHKGQYRRAIDVDGEDNPYLVEVLNNANPDDEDYICKDGTLIKGIDTITWTVSVPYSSHSIAVADLLTTDEEKVVGYLHDVVEDTEWQLSEVTHEAGTIHSIVHTPSNDGGYFEQKSIGLKANIYNSLKLLTKSPKQNYQAYIFNISRCHLATKVKLADISHNLSCNPAEHAKEKYLRAIPFLLNAL